MKDTPADRLKALRVAAGFTSATEAARAYGWAPSTYMGHENGSRGLNAAAAHKYARAFGADWADLLTGEKSEWHSSGEEQGTPLMGMLGVRPILPSLADAPRIPVGVEGYRSEELRAFISLPGPPTEYIICYVGRHDMLLIGDEVVVAIDVPNRGKSYETWIATENKDGETYFFRHRPFGDDPLDLEQLSDHDFFALPGLEAIGLVVAVYEDRKRRRSIEALGLRKTR